MTWRLLNAGFGEPLPHEELQLIRDLGFAGIRQDLRAGAGYPAAAALVANAMAIRDSRAIFVVDTTGAEELGSYVARAARGMALQANVVVEVGNEEDGEPEFREAPDVFGRLVAAVARAVDQVDSGVRVISGGTRSTSQEAMAWLRAAAAHFPADAGVGFHSYRSGPPDEPLPGYRSRGDEFARLYEAAAGRSVWHTEVGWHTAPRPRPFPQCWRKTRLTDEQVLAYLRDELAINEANCVPSFVVYQWNDGPTDSWRDRFGIRRLDGSLKPQALALPSAERIVRILER